MLFFTTYDFYKLGKQPKFCLFFSLEFIHNALIRRSDYRFKFYDCPFYTSEENHADENMISDEKKHDFGERLLRCRKTTMPVRPKKYTESAFYDFPERKYSVSHHSDDGTRSSRS